MTPRTKGERLSDVLKNHQEESFPLDLTLDGPILSMPHPRLLLASWDWEENPKKIVPREVIHGWHYSAYIDSNTAARFHKNVEMNFVGKPWNVYRFLQEGFNEGIIEFPGIGACYLSRRAFEEEPGSDLSHHLIPIWLGYALSPELWGPEGKWPKFHGILNSLFQKHHLMNSSGFPGYYQLNQKAERLQQLGFQGTSLDKMVLLVLPWTFSLSALRKLEVVIQQEFPCLS